jgi:hypothetical protein
MLCAVFVRTLKPGVTFEEFRAAWVPEPRGGEYPARVRIGRNVANQRQVITILELDASPESFQGIAKELTRSDALARLSAIVESTELQGIYEDVFSPDAMKSFLGAGS